MKARVPQLSNRQRKLAKQEIDILILYKLLFLLENYL